MHVKNQRKSHHCLNCNAEIGEVNFCPNCGQLNHSGKETALELLSELVGDFLHFDNKVTRSLFPLLFKPGKLTAEYNNGRRIRYLHPVRLFISVTVIMLLVTSLSKKSDTVNVEKDTSLINTDSVGFTITFDKKGKVNYYDIKRLVDAGITDENKLLDSLDIENTYENRLNMRRAVKMDSMKSNEILETIKHYLPWILFTLMPVFAFILWLIYIRRKIWYVDHLIYSFHLHSATFIIITLDSLLSFVSLGGWIMWYIPVYYYVSLHTVYLQNWGKTILKGTFVGILYFFLVVVLAVTVFGYFFSSLSD